jgi:2-aminoadipate transaminase
MNPFSFSKKCVRTPESPISYFMEHAIENPSLISLAAGFVDSESLPAQQVADAVADLLADRNTAQAALQYGTTQGYSALREQILKLVCSLDGIAPDQTAVKSKDVVVTTGAQQLLYMLSELLLDPGDIVITEAPSYFVFHSVLEGNGVRVLTVPMDDEGMDIDALNQLLARLQESDQLGKVKLIYVVDYFQNPSGRTLSLPRRKHLFETIRRFSTKQRLLLLEDAAYRELRYEGDDIPSVKRFDERNEHVIYAGTFSKPCAAGLKTGYALMPGELMMPFLRLKGNHDFGSNNFSQYIVHRLLETGAYHKHVEYLRSVYRVKRDAMIGALEAEFGDWTGVRWTHPRGGMFIWLTMPNDVDLGPNGPVLDAAIREGVLYIPGEFGHVCADGPKPTNEARLSFGDATPDQIREGVRRFRRAVDLAIDKKPQKELLAVR